MQVSLFIVGILVEGFVFGGLARIIVLGSQRLTGSETTLVGIAGAAVGALIVNAATRRRVGCSVGSRQTGQSAPWRFTTLWVILAGECAPFSMSWLTVRAYYASEAHNKWGRTNERGPAI
jgi:uncharacterized membrane protein